MVFQSAYYFLVALIHIGFAPSGGYDLMVPESTHYEVVFSATQPEQVEVKVELNLQDSLLFMSPYGPKPERWPQYVRNLRALTESGDELNVTPRDSTAWIIEEYPKGQKVHIQYDLILDHEKIPWPGGIDGVAYKRDWGLMLSGRSLFIMNGTGKRPVSVQFKKPGDWKVTVPWEPSSSAPEAYTAKNHRDLQESFIFAGTHTEHTLERDGFTLEFVLGGAAIEKDHIRYQKMAGDVMDYYIALMGGVPRTDPSPGTRKSMVIISESEQLDGEVIGNHISMFMNPHGDAMQQMIGWFMFAHEFFHLWNGKTLLFDSTETDWFKEGVSNYYTIKALHQIGFADEQAILGMLDGLFYQRYVNDPGFRTLAPSEAASGFSKDNHWGLIYGGGLFAGLAMDLKIRHRTENSRSMDDVMRYFYSQYNYKDHLILQADILQAANSFGQTDFTDFLNSSVKGVAPVPIKDYFIYAGILTDTDTGHLSLRHKDEKTPLEARIWEGFLGTHD